MKCSRAGRPMACWTSPSGKKEETLMWKKVKRNHLWLYEAEEWAVRGRLLWR